MNSDSKGEVRKRGFGKADVFSPWPGRLARSFEGSSGRDARATQSQPDALARDSTGNQASNARFHSTPFVPQGRATRLLEDSRQGPRSLATLSLANASGCDGGTLRVRPLDTNASDQPLSPKRGEGSGKPNGPLARAPGWYSLSTYFCLLFFTFLPLSFSPRARSEEPAQSPPKLLVDAYHAHTFLETIPDLQNQQYHLLHSPARAIECLRRLGWEVEAQLVPWTPERLREADAILIDLVSADLPPFLTHEIDAIEQYIKGGGGLFLVLDHSNCYFHNHVLGPLADRLGIALESETLCDRTPLALGDGHGWIALRDIRPHPATEGVREIAIQSGGTVPSDVGIVFSSEQSWGDQAIVPPYGGVGGLGFYGDFYQQPNERKGPLGAVGAKEIDRGRIFVIADQNGAGGMFLNYLDNRRLWLQGMHWAAKRPLPSNSDWEDFLDRPEPDRPLFWCLEPSSPQRWKFGNDAGKGYYHLFAWLNKWSDARGTPRIVKNARFMIIPDRFVFEDPESLQQVQSFLAVSGNILFLLEWDETEESLIAFGQSKKLLPQRVKRPTKESDLWYLMTTDSGATICCIRGFHCDNEHLAAPESPESDREARVVESLLQVFSEFNIQPNSRHSRGDRWLDELEE